MATDLSQWGTEALQTALEQTFDRIEALVISLSASQREYPYHPGINPPVWELGHSAFFYENFIFMALDGLASYDPSMDKVWDSFELDHEDRWSSSLFPSFEATLSYVETVRGRLRERLLSRSLFPQERYLYRYAICHQNMHIESMIWARQTLGLPAPATTLSLDEASAETTSQPSGDDIEVRGGSVVIGLPADSAEFSGEDFGFDNEKPRFTMPINHFSISRTLVSCGEFLRFVEDAGYARQEFWSQGGRSWLQRAAKRPLAPLWDPAAAAYTGTAASLEPPVHPQYWRHRDGCWEVRHFDRWQPLRTNFPVVHVSYWEAEAYCAWAGRRLPTEFEWELAALDNRPGGDFRSLPWSGQQSSDAQGFADMDARRLARLPVAALAESASPAGCLQMIGTCWEWTSSQFMPYDGFAVDMYPFMSTLQFGDHKTTKGGSCATSSLLIRGTYRQAYQPDRFDAFTGFRTCALEASS